MKKNYESPEIKIVKVEVENGFAGSGFADKPEVIEELYLDSDNLDNVEDGGTGW